MPWKIQKLSSKLQSGDKVLIDDHTSQKKAKILIGLHRELGPETRFKDRVSHCLESRHRAQDVQPCVPSSSLVYPPAFLLKNLNEVL